MKALPIAVCRTSRRLLSMLGRGGSLPGSLALKMEPDILKEIEISGPVILVTGTNGKTSTANMAADLLNAAGYQTVTNRKGDNLREGIVTALLSQTTLGGKLKADAAVLEVDELNVKHILPALPVTAIVVNNFFRDQLDRAREMEQLIESIENVLPDFRGTLILNGNDPNVLRLRDKAPNARVLTFGLAPTKDSVAVTGEASEGKFCPRCGSRLEYDFYQYSHIGQFHCTNCDFGTPKLDVRVEHADAAANTFDWNGYQFHSPYEGIYSMYNCAAVLAVLRLLNIPVTIVNEVFAHAPQPAGRNEKFTTKKGRAVLNLVKNPTGANEVMKVIETDSNEKVVVIVLNDNEQDGTDVSWIYDTHFEKLMADSTKKIVCTGSRSGDMALRLVYGGWKGDLEIKPDLESAISDALQEHANVYVVSTYTALVPSRAAIVKEVQA